MKSLESSFQNIGGQFITPIEQIAERLKTIKAFVFDWDGVFNAGHKGGQTLSSFSEADSMGTNILRFGHWLQHGELPFVAIVSGAQNPAAIQLSEREHFQMMASRFISKAGILDHLAATYHIQPEEVAFFYDDILDLSLAEKVGLRIAIQRTASPLFRQHIEDARLCDYITGHTGGQHAVREASELLLGISNQYTKALEHRMRFSAPYQEYLKQRNAITTEFLEFSDSE